MNRRYGMIFVMLLCAALLGGCGEYGYSGVEINNMEALSGDLRSVMIKRSYALDIEFNARTGDEEVLRSLSEELISGVFYESSDPKGGDYLKYQYGGCKMEPEMQKTLSGYSYKVRILPEYFTDAGEEAYVDSEVARITGLVGPDAGEYDKVKFVHDHICRTVTYDKVHKHTKGSGHYQSTAYGCLYYHTALCQGYSVLAYRLLKELGMDARIVTGDLNINGKTERHAWNIVRIGDRYYNMDITMDDISGNYDCFLKSEESFSADHKRDAGFCSEEFCEAYPMADEDYVYE